MPGLKQIFILELTLSEALALKVILGNHSERSKEAIGLSSQQCKEMSVLYDLLPHPDEE